MIDGFKPHKKKQKEGPIQSAVVKYAIATYGDRILPIKRQAGRFGTNGYPDYEFLILNDAFDIEFKAPGADCTDLQRQRHAEMRARGRRVYVCDNVTSGKGIIDKEMHRQRRVA